MHWNERRSRKGKPRQALRGKRFTVGYNPLHSNAATFIVASFLLRNW
jgi:hypothetical protein